MSADAQRWRQGAVAVAVVTGGRLIAVDTGQHPAHVGVSSKSGKEPDGYSSVPGTRNSVVDLPTA